MSEILSDLSLTNLQLTGHLHVNTHNVIDKFGNVYPQNHYSSLGGNITNTHVDSIILNASSFNASSKLDSTIFLNATNGVLFSLPNANVLANVDIPNQTAMWFWEDNQLKLITKQNNLLSTLVIS